MPNVFVEKIKTVIKKLLSLLCGWEDIVNSPQICLYIYCFSMRNQGGIFGITDITFRITDSES